MEFFVKKVEQICLGELYMWKGRGESRKIWKTKRKGHTHTHTYIYTKTLQYILNRSFSKRVRTICFIDT